MAVKCEHCGKSNKSSVSKCTHCGAALKNNNAGSGGSGGSGGGGGGGSMLSKNNSSERYPHSNFQGIDINFDVAAAALVGLRDSIAHLGEVGGNYGKVDFSKVPAVDGSDVASKTKCLASTFGIGGSDCVLNQMFNNFRKTLDLAANQRFGGKLNGKYSDRVLSSYDSLDKYIKDYQFDPSDFGNQEKAAAASAYLNALLSINDKTEFRDNNDGSSTCYTTGADGRNYEIILKGGDIVSIGLLTGTMQNFGESSSVPDQYSNALSSIGENTNYTENSDGSRTYVLTDDSGKPFMVNTDGSGMKITGMGDLDSSTKYNYNNGQLNSTTYKNDGGTIRTTRTGNGVKVEQYDSSKDNTIRGPWQDITTEYVEGYRDAVVQDISMRNHNSQTHAFEGVSDTLEDYEKAFYNRMVTSVEEQKEIKGIDGLKSYEKIVDFFEQDLKDRASLEEMEITVAGAKRTTYELGKQLAAATEKYEDYAYNYDDYVRKGDTEIEQKKDDAEIEMQKAQEAYDNALKEQKSFEQKSRNIDIRRIEFDSVTGISKVDLADNQQYYDLKYNSAKYYEDYYTDLSVEKQAEINEYSENLKSEWNTAFKKMLNSGEIVLYGTDYDEEIKQEAYEKFFESYEEKRKQNNEVTLNDLISTQCIYAQELESSKLSKVALLLKMPDRDNYARRDENGNVITTIARHEVTDVPNNLGLIDAAGYMEYDTVHDFYDSNGNKITDDIEIAIYCANNNLSPLVREGHSYEYARDLSALTSYGDNKYNPNNFTTDNAVQSYVYAKNKYGIDEGIKFFDYFNDLGAQIIGYTAADEKIKDIMTAYDNNKERYGSIISEISRFKDVSGEALYNGLEGWVQHMDDFFQADGRRSAYDYESQGLIQNLASNEFEGTVYQSVFEIGSSIGNMLPSIATTAIAGAMTGGLGWGAGAIKALQFATTFGTMGLSAAGATKEQAMQNGMDATTATVYGLMSGLSETALESVLGSLPGIGQMGDYFEKFGGATAFFGKMFSEGLEESVQEVVDAALNTLFTGEKFTVDPEAVLKSGIYGAITSGIMSGAGGVARAAIDTSLITTNIVIDGIVQKTSTTPTGLDFLAQKYDGMSLTEKLTSEELKSDLLHLNDIRSDLAAETSDILGSEDFETRYRAYESETTSDKLTREEYASILAVEEAIDKSRKANIVGQEIATKMDERTAQMQEYGELAKDVAKLERKLNLDSGEQTNNSTSTRNPSSSDLANTAELFEKRAKLAELEQKIDKNGIELYDQYAIEKAELEQLKKNVKDKVIPNNLDTIEKIERQEKKIDLYEKYISEVISGKIDSNENFEVAVTNYEYYADQLNDKHSSINEAESKKIELESKLDDLNNQRKGSQNIDSKLAKEIVDTRNEINNLQKLIDEIREGMSSLTQRVKSSLETIKSSAGEDTRKLKIAQDLLSSDLDIKQQQLDAIKSDIKALEKREANLKNQKSSKVEEVSNEIKTKKEQIAKLETEIENDQKMIDKNNTILAEKVDNLVSFKDEAAKFDVDLDTDSDSASILKDAGKEVVDTIKDAIKDELKDDDDSSNEIVDSAQAEEVANVNGSISKLLDESIKPAINLDTTTEDVVNYGSNDKPSVNSTSTSEETSSISFSSMERDDIVDLFKNTEMTNEEFISSFEKLAQSGIDNVSLLHEILLNRGKTPNAGFGGIFDIAKSEIAKSNPSLAAAYFFLFSALPSELNSLISSMSESNIKKAIDLVRNTYKNNNIDFLLQTLTVENIGKVSSALGENIYTQLSKSQIMDLYNSGNREFIKYLNNKQFVNLMEITDDSSLVEIFKTNEKRHVNVDYDFVRSDGTTFNIELKNIIKSEGKKVYVYVVDGKTVYSETNIMVDLFTNGELATKVRDEFLSVENLENASSRDGYIGNFDSDGNIVISENTKSMVSDVVNNYTNNQESYLDTVRDGDPNLRFGVDQKAKSTNGIRWYIENGHIVDIVDEESYHRLIDHFSTKYNMSEKTICKALEYVIDTTGVCTYADLANMILEHFKDNSIEFKKVFGFDMYEFENGKKCLNSRALILDMFIRANSPDLGIESDVRKPTIFSINPNTGERILNLATDENGNTIYSDKMQVGISNTRDGYSVHAEKYLSDYGIDIAAQKLNYIDANGNIDIEALKADIKDRLIRGEHVAIAERAKMITYTDANGNEVEILDPNQKDLVFYNLDGKDDTHILSWHEGGGHITSIVGMTEDGLIVVSWGDKHEIKFSDLTPDNCIFQSAVITSPEVINATSDTEVYEELSKMDAKTLAERIRTTDIDLDYVLKNYISLDTIKELSEIMSPNELLSKVRSSRSVERVLDAYNGKLSQAEFSNLISTLTNEQVMLALRANSKYSSEIINSANLQYIWNNTSNREILTTIAQSIKDIVTNNKLSKVTIDNLSWIKKTFKLNSEQLAIVNNEIKNKVTNPDNLKTMSTADLVDLFSSVRNYSILDEIFSRNNKGEGIILSIGTNTLSEYLATKSLSEITAIKNRLDVMDYMFFDRAVGKIINSKVDEFFSEDNTDFGLIGKIDPELLTNELSKKTDSEINNIRERLNDNERAIFDKYVNEISEKRNQAKSKLDDAISKGYIKSYIDALLDEDVRSLILSSNNNDFVNLLNNKGLLKACDEIKYDTNGRRFYDAMISKIFESLNSGDTKLVDILLDNYDVCNIIVKNTQGLSKDFYNLITKNHENFLNHLVEIVNLDTKGASFIINALDISAREYVVNQMIERYMSGNESYKESLLKISIPDECLTQEFIDKFTYRDVEAFSFLRYLARKDNSSKLNELLRDRDLKIIEGINPETGLVGIYDKIYTDIADIIKKGNIFNGRNKSKFIDYVLELDLDSKTKDELISAFPKKAKIADALRQKSNSELSHVIIDYYFGDTSQDVIRNISELMNYQIEKGLTLDIDNAKIYRDLLNFENLSQEEITFLIESLESKDIAKELAKDLLTLSKNPVDLKFVDSSSEEIIDFGKLNEVIETAETKKIDEISDKNVKTIKGSILSLITPEMSELEKARLIYLELGKKVDYSSLYRHAIKDKIPNALYDQEYNRKLTVADLEKNNSIICATWAQVYSEMLLAAGFKPEQIVIQRLTTGEEVNNTDEKGNKYVYNSHAAIYVLLDDGSVLIPDMTIPFKQADYYNVKVENETSGFILIDKSQIELLSMDYETVENYYKEKDLLSYYPILESLSGEPANISQSYENVLKLCGDYFYSFILNDEVLKNSGKFTENSLKKLKAERQKYEKYFFGSFNDANKEVIAEIDKKLEPKLTKSDFFKEEVTEEVRRDMVNADMELFDTLSEFDDMKIEKLAMYAQTIKAITSMFRIDNVTDRNAGILQAYMRDMATKEGILKGVGSRNGKSMTITLDLETEKNSLKIKIYDEKTGNAFTSIYIKVDKDGNYVVTSNDIKNAINELFAKTDETIIREQVATLSENDIGLLESIGLDLSKYKPTEIESDTKPITQAQDEDIEVMDFGIIPSNETKTEEVNDFGATTSPVVTATVGGRKILINTSDKTSINPTPTPTPTAIEKETKLINLYGDNRVSMYKPDGTLRPFQLVTEQDKHIVGTKNWWKNAYKFIPDAPGSTTGTWEINTTRGFICDPADIKIAEKLYQDIDKYMSKQTTKISYDNLPANLLAPSDYVTRSNAYSERIIKKQFGIGEPVAPGTAGFRGTLLGVSEDIVGYVAVSGYSAGSTSGNLIFVPTTSYGIVYRSKDGNLLQPIHTHLYPVLDLDRINYVTTPSASTSTTTSASTSTTTPAPISTSTSPSPSTSTSS